MKMNTFSIVARCQETGHIGAAAATRFPAVGAHSPTLKAKVGAIASQGWINPLLGEKGIALLDKGYTANEALSKLLNQDPGRELRQVAILDRYGNCAAYTGLENDDVKGHIIDKGFCIQGNLLADDDVLIKMKQTYLNTEGPLALKLIKTLEAGEAAGGDRRGKQSAVVKVVVEDGFPYVDYRVDDHPDPIAELRRIYDANSDGFITKYFEWIDAVKQGVKLE